MWGKNRRGILQLGGGWSLWEKKIQRMRFPEQGRNKTREEGGERWGHTGWE